MLLIIDNYDSFTYNLAQYFSELGAAVKVARNDAISIEEIELMQPERIVISPGPGYPDKAGISNGLIMRFSGRIPVLGVCLGHQAIGSVFGGRIRKAGAVMHGKVSAIYHDGLGVFNDMPCPFQATRYHSLAVDRASIPGCLVVSAWTGDGEVMGLRHREYKVEGVQFHPESVLTQDGRKILGNFMAF